MEKEEFLAQFKKGIEELKSRVTMKDALDLYNIHLPRNRKIPCMKHNEKTASMHIYEDHYYCYGCGAHGDAIEFVSEREGITRYEAYLVLGGRPIGSQNSKGFCRQKREAGSRQGNGQENMKYLQCLEQWRKQLIEEVYCHRQKYRDAIPYSDEWVQEYHSLEQAEQALEQIESEIGREKRGML